MKDSHSFDSGSNPDGSIVFTGQNFFLHFRTRNSAWKILGLSCEM
jgi:hypothetical protein